MTFDRNEPIPVDALRQTAKRRDVCDAMRQFYQEVDAEIAKQPGTCWNRALCCNFGQYGHKLFATALEVSYYVAGHATPLPITEEACPHARDGICHAREHRPLGCRVFYCDPEAAHWQSALTERYLSRLRIMHAELKVPYFYAEWLHVLSALETNPA